MADLAQWLAALPLGAAIRRLTWAIPLLQTLHILSTSMVLSSLIMVSLRLWRSSVPGTVRARGRRYLPWVWGSLIVLVITGAGLIAGNPRSVRDPALIAKLWLMLPAGALTLVLALMTRAALEKGGGGRLMMGTAAAGTLTLWFAVTLLGRGRWIFNFLS